MKTILGDVFIVPNSIGPFSEHFHFDREYNAIANAFPDLENGDMVQVWFTGGDGNENWGDHYYLAGTFLQYHFLPAAIFDGKKEGDVIEFEAVAKICGSGDRSSLEEKGFVEGEKFVVSLTLNQKGYRYSRFGAFEDVLAKLKSRNKSSAAA